MKLGVVMTCILIQKKNLRVDRHHRSTDHKHYLLVSSIRYRLENVSAYGTESYNADTNVVLPDVYESVYVLSITSPVDDATALQSP
jgi:hypothetical protein